MVSAPDRVPPVHPRVHVSDDSAHITIHDFQQLIRQMYLEKDVARGVDGTFMWLMEEVGELAAALREGTHDELAAEFADVLAWLTTIANVKGVDLGRRGTQEVRLRVPRLRSMGLHLRRRRQAIETVSRQSSVHCEPTMIDAVSDGGHAAQPPLDSASNDQSCGCCRTCRRRPNPP